MSWFIEITKRLTIITKIWALHTTCDGLSQISIIVSSSVSRSVRWCLSGIIDACAHLIVQWFIIQIIYFYFFQIMPIRTNLFIYFCSFLNIRITFNVLFSNNHWIFMSYVWRNCLTHCMFASGHLARWNLMTLMPATEKVGSCFVLKRSLLHRSISSKRHFHRLSCIRPTFMVISYMYFWTLNLRKTNIVFYWPFRTWSFVAAIKLYKFTFTKKNLLKILFKILIDQNRCGRITPHLFVKVFYFNYTKSSLELG